MMSALSIQFSAHLSPQSRVWVYQTDKKLTNELVEALSNELKVFFQSWAAHGTSLYADFSFVTPYNLVVAVDDTKVPPSGCSIDSLVRFLTALGAKYELDFFVRMKVVALVSGEWKQLNFEEVKNNDTEIVILDPTLTILSDFVEKGLTSPHDSGLKVLFN